MKPVALVPTLCTLGNAFCGFLAIAKGADALALWSAAGDAPSAETLERFHGLLSTGALLVFLAMVFDALDGRLARMTQQTSDFGAMLDSLTDALTFGAAPALLLKCLIETQRDHLPALFTPKMTLLLTVLFVCCALLRLARFTVETEDEADSHDAFRGLPTPAAAGMVCSSILVYSILASGTPPRLLAAFVEPETLRAWMEHIDEQFLTALLLAMPLLGILMVSKVPYVHLFNRFMRGRRPYTYVAQTVFLLFLLALLEEWALFLGFLGYVALCPLLVRIGAIRVTMAQPAAGAEDG